MEEHKEKKFKTHQKISKVLFMIFMIFLFLYLLLYFDIITPQYEIIIFRRLFRFLILLYAFLLLPTYIIYLFVTTIFVFKNYKKILFLNLIAFCLIFIPFILTMTGFCFEECRYLSKEEIISRSLNQVAKTCKKEFENEKEQPFQCLTFEDIKQKYPECFDGKISDKCITENFFLVYRIERNYWFLLFPSSWFSGDQLYLIYTDIPYRKPNPDKYYEDYLSIELCQRSK